jgi:Pyruvate/2-oxoacid:ferredoxin oxidoreductase delta subunit
MVDGREIHPAEPGELIRRKVVLDFPRDLLNKPIVWNLSKRYDLSFNILRANVDDGRGYLVLELEGSSSDYESGLAFLSDLGVSSQPLAERVSLDKTKCTECGACTGICPTRSFKQDSESMEVVFDRTQCIACGVCVKSCPARAISLQLA